MSDSTLCEKLKVIIRGDIISYMSAAEKEREKRLSEINNVLLALEKAHHVSNLLMIIESCSNTSTNIRIFKAARSAIFS